MLHKYLSTILLSLCFTVTTHAKPIETILGPLETNDPIVDQLLDSEAMLRLQHIDQCGINFYFGYNPPFSRYDHCLGVYALLKRYNAPQKECIAGLLHDVSHTVFSHVGDVLFDEEGYQDNIHAWHLEQMGLGELLAGHNITIEEVLPDNEEYKALEQELPTLCADRIEYNLHKAYVFGMIDTQKINKLLKDLHFENDTWFFSSPKSAKKLADLSLYFTEHFYGAPYNLALMQITAQMLQQAMDIGLITSDEVHFGKDLDILERLKTNEDPIIQKGIIQCSDIHAHVELAENEDYDVHIYTKFRGIDPWVMQEGELHKLTDLDPSYKKRYERIKAHVAKGVKIRFK